jgi:hypothetical protein
MIIIIFIPSLNSPIGKAVGTASAGPEFKSPTLTEFVVKFVFFGVFLQ